jgi:HK97 family phage portal protein
VSLFRPGREQRSFDTLADLIAERTIGRVHSKMPVNDDSSLTNSAVWACVDLISEIVSTMPFDEYRRGGAGELLELPKPPLLDDPTGDSSGLEVWLRQALVSLLLRGNAYGLVLAVGGDGWPTQIESLHPDRVQVERLRTIGPVTWRLDAKPIERWPAGPLWHLPAYCAPGSPVGMSPIRYAAETIGLGLAVTKFGAQWFGDGAHPTSTVESPHEITEEQAKVIKARVLRAMGETREPLVLGSDTKLNAVQVAPEESQFLETSQANVADVCRYFRVPPEAIGGKAADSLTYANQEQRGIALLTNTVNGWLVRLERSLTRLRPRPRFVKANPDSLLRVDLATRYKAHDLGLRGGWLSRNDVRRIEDRPPIPDGDEYLWPPYTTSLDTGGDTEANAGSDDAVPRR